MLHLIASIIGAWFFADFLSGLAHWAVDRVMARKGNAFLNSLIDDNDLHHSQPVAMLKFSLYENVRVAINVMWPVALILYLIGAPTFVWLGFFFLAFANGVHWFSHRRRNHFLIKSFQNVGIFASFDHHREHHMSDNQLIDRNEASVKYCVMTDWVNPVLDSVSFFRFLELLLKVNRDQL